MNTEKDTGTEAGEDNLNREQQPEQNEHAQGNEDEGGEQQPELELQGGDEGDKKPEAKAGEEKPEGDKGAQRSKPNPFRNRISELTAEKKGTERELQAARERIAELERNQQQAQEGEGEQQPPPRQPAKRADTVPAEMVQQLAQKQAQQIAADTRFDADCNATFDKGVKEYADFQEAMANFNALGGLERDVIEDALTTDAPHQVLYDLGSDPEKAASILKLPRGKRIAEFTKMTMKAPPKPVVSKAPAPIKPVSGNAKKDFDFNDDSADDSEWFSKRNEAVRAAGRI